MLTADRETSGAKTSTQRPAKRQRDAEGMTVNMHRLGESFVEKVVDVRRRVTVDGKATAPGESLEFLALIQGWQSEARRERREQLLKLNDIGLRIALEHATAKDVFFIPEVHFAEEKPMLADDDGWWYQVPERVGNAEFARREKVSRTRSGERNDRLYALRVMGQKV